MHSPALHLKILQYLADGNVGKVTWFHEMKVQVRQS